MGNHGIFCFLGCPNAGRRVPQAEEEQLATAMAASIALQRGNGLMAPASPPAVVPPPATRPAPAAVPIGNGTAAVTAAEPNWVPDWAGSTAPGGGGSAVLGGGGGDGIARAGSANPSGAATAAAAAMAPGNVTKCRICNWEGNQYRAYFHFKVVSQPFVIASTMRSRVLLPLDGKLPWLRSHAAVKVLQR